MLVDDARGVRRSPGSRLPGRPAGDRHPRRAAGRHHARRPAARAAAWRRRPGPDDIAKLLLTSGSTGQPKAVICLHRGVAVERRPDRRLLRRSRAAGGGQPGALEPQPGRQRHPADGHRIAAARSTSTPASRSPAALRRDGAQPARGRADLPQHGARPAGTCWPASWSGTTAWRARFFSRVRRAAVRRRGAGPEHLRPHPGRGPCARSARGSASPAAMARPRPGPTATNVHWPNLTMGLMGLPVPGTDGEAGARAQGRLEFRVKGPQISAGYYRNPEATAAAFDEEGFYRLGDAARPVDPRPARARAGLRRPAVGELQAVHRHLRQRRRPAGGGGLGHRRRGGRRGGLRRGLWRRGPADLPQPARSAPARSERRPRRGARRSRRLQRPRRRAAAAGSTAR